VHVERAVWRKSSADSATVVSGSLGQSHFDSQSSIKWDGTQLDMSSIRIVGDNLQQRLEGLTFSVKNFPESLLKRMQVFSIPAKRWQETQVKASEYLGKETLMQLVSSVTPGSPRVRLGKAPADWRQAEGPAMAGTTEGLLIPCVPTVRPLGLSTSIPANAGARYLLTVHDPRSEYPCTLEQGAWIPSSKRPAEATRIHGRLVHKRPLWGGATVHYHGALFEVLRYVEKRTPDKVRGSSRTGVLTVRLEDVQCVARAPLR
jgi:hypothetical protein